MRSVKVKPTNVEEEEGKKSKKDSGSATCSLQSYSGTDVSITKKDKEDVEKRYKDTAKVAYMELAEGISQIMKTTCHDSLAQGYLLLGTKKTILYCANGNTPIYASKPTNTDSKPMILTQEDSYSYLISPKHTPSEKRINESFPNEHVALSETKLSGNATSIAPDEALLNKVDKSNRPRRKLCRIT